MPQVKTILTSLLAVSLLSSGTTLTLQGTATDTAYAASVSATSVKTAKDTSLPLKWSVATDGIGMYDKLPILNGILFYTANNTLYAKNIATGQVKWSYKNGGEPQILTNSSIFFIDNNEQLVKVSADTGKLLWKVKVSKRPIEVGAQARLINGKVYFSNESGGVAAYHPVTGKKIWENTNIPMYVGTIYGEYKGVLVVSSTVDNTRTQFYGLDLATGKKLWRTEGLYGYVGVQEGHLVLRKQVNEQYDAEATPVPGHLLTLVQLDPATGKISGQEDYEPLNDIDRMSNYYTSIQNSYIYTAAGNLDKDEYTLTRFTRGQSKETATKSYESYGRWLAGPTNGMAFFQKETQITGVNLQNDRVVTFDNPASKVELLQRVGKAVFTIYENGYLSINHADTGALFGIIKTGAGYHYFGNVTIEKGIALIPTERKLLAVALPKELQ
ncbi:outer membrane protein assembly factor BamB family protein [Paenibacillus sp. IHBB 3054]|uniref:outer membrane protein assembly factor BamB family protein n=1 Tax=Paenibacillus sp. IHBB 3054 TaxID=3425689 RepID=UPI003F66F776